jgi:SAM-dependent methyltransferase
MQERDVNTARDVRKIREKLAINISRTDFWWANNREFHNLENGADEGYLTYLPSFNDLDFEDIVNNLIRLPSSKVVNILDVGCGRGAFIDKCRRNWGKRVKVFGVDLKHKIHNKRVDIRNGDMHNLVDIFDLNSMDIVISVRALEYAADPWFVVKEINKVLKPGGIALLSYTPFNMSKIDASRGYEFDKDGAKSLVNYLESVCGMEVKVVDDEYCNLSFCKTEDRLWLPLSYSNMIKHRSPVGVGFDPFQYNTVGYKFNQ